MGLPMGSWMGRAYPLHPPGVLSRVSQGLDIHPGHSSYLETWTVPWDTAKFLRRATKALMCDPQYSQPECKPSYWEERNPLPAQTPFLGEMLIYLKQIILRSI